MATGLVFLSSALLVGALNTKKSEYDSATAFLAALSRLNSNLDIAVLQIKTLDRLDYDDIATLETELSRATNRLNADLPDEAALKAALQRKAEYIEDLKSRQAIFRNSLSILPVLIDSLRKTGFLVDQALEAAVFRGVFATDEFKPQPFAQAVARIEARPEFYGVKTKEAWRQLEAHVDKIRSIVPEVNEIVRRIQAVPVAGALDIVMERIADEREKQLIRSRTSLYGLFVLTIFLLAIAVHRVIALWRHRTILEVKVRERTTDLQHANEELKREIMEKQLMQQKLVQAQKLESIGQLAAGVAHEINTPTQYVSDNIAFLRTSFDELTKVLSSFAELSQSTGQVDAEELKRPFLTTDLDFLREEIPRAIKESADGVDYITRIVRALKDFSHQSEDPAPEDLNRAIENTAAVARNEWKYVAELIIDQDENMRPVPCVLNQFKQVLLNLIVNAAHAISDVVGASGDVGRITIRTRQRKNHAEVQIEDTGSGIPEEIRHRIFDPFFTTKEVGLGTGQGLSIVHNIIVEKHGGTISVDSEPGRGSCFTIRLLSVPLEETPALEAACAAG